jgi:nitrogen-specific signal transduction histidine kinase
MMGAATKNRIIDELAVSILEQLPTPVMAVNRDMGIMFMNRAGLTFLEIAYRDRAIDRLEELLAEFDGHLTTALVSMQEYQPAEADTQKTAHRVP